jgi:hypothetical protein
LLFISFFVVVEMLLPPQPGSADDNDNDDDDDDEDCKVRSVCPCRVKDSIMTVQGQKVSKKCLLASANSSRSPSEQCRSPSEQCR